MSLVVLCMFLAVLALTVIATGYARRYALRTDLLDIPNARSSHASPTPRGGGIAIVIVFSGATLALASARMLDHRLAAALLGGGGLMALVGFLDDRRSLLARWRIMVHLVAAIIAVSLIGGVPERSLNLWHLHGLWTGRAIAVITVMWVSNFFNFMDGIDGIAASEAVFVAGAGAWLGARHAVSHGVFLTLLALAAASLGFLCWNWPPAKIFMGDVGSGFLGFVIAALALASSQSGALPIEVWPILAGVFLVDATVTLLMRALRGQRWFEPHRSHAYQRLSRILRNHLPVTVATAALNIGWLLPWAWLAATIPQWAAYCMTAALAPVVVTILAIGAGRGDS